MTGYDEYIHGIETEIEEIEGRIAEVDAEIAVTRGRIERFEHAQTVVGAVGIAVLAILLLLCGISALHSRE